MQHFLSLRGTFHLDEVNAFTVGAITWSVVQVIAESEVWRGRQHELESRNGVTRARVSFLAFLRLCVPVEGQPGVVDGGIEQRVIQQ